jgi:hypothetical protein
LCNTSLKERWNKLEDEEEDVGSYLTTAGEREGTGILKKKHWLAPFGDLALNKRVNLWQVILVCKGLLQLTQYR